MIERATTRKKDMTKEEACGFLKELLYNYRYFPGMVNISGAPLENMSELGTATLRGIITFMRVHIVIIHEERNKHSKSDVKYSEIIARCNDTIRYVEFLLRNISEEKKVCLAKFRNNKYFKVGDSVVIFHSDKWIEGTVARLIAEEDRSLYTKAGINIPEHEEVIIGFWDWKILKTEEFEYLTSGKDVRFLELWEESIRRLLERNPLGKNIFDIETGISEIENIRLNNTLPEKNGDIDRKLCEFMKYDTSRDSTIYDTACGMVTMASRLNVKVEAEFNEIYLLAGPRDGVGDVVRDYEEKVRIRHEKNLKFVASGEK